MGRVTKTKTTIERVRLTGKREDVQRASERYDADDGWRFAGGGPLRVKGLTVDATRWYVVFERERLQ